MKKNIKEEEDDGETNDEVKNNTDQNIKLGLEAFNEEDSDSNNSEKFRRKML